VGLLSTTKYAVASVLKNRRRSVFAIVGIVLSLSLVSGSWIAVDSSGLGVLRGALKNYRFDFDASYYGIQWTDITEGSTGRVIDLIKSIDEVTSVAPTAFQWGWTAVNASSGESYANQYLSNVGGIVYLTSNSTPLLDAYRVEGDLPDNGTLAIPEAVAKALNISLGDSLVVSYVVYGGYYDANTSRYVQNNYFINLSYPVSQIWTQDPDAQPYNYYYDYMGISKSGDNVILWDSMNPVFMNLADLPSVMGAPNASTNVPTSLTYYIWIDRGSVIRLGDLSGTVDRIKSIEVHLDRALWPENLQVQNEVIYPIMDVAPHLEVFKLVYLALSAPVIGLGMYLSIVGVDLGVTERRRELGILKSRGASNGQVRSTLMVEALMLGAVAGLLGLMIGVGVSRPLVGSTSVLFDSPGADTLGTDFMVSPLTIIVSMFLGVGLMLLSSYRPFRRASKVEISEALHFYTPKAAQIEYKLRWDAVLLFLAVLSILSVWLGVGAIRDMESSWMTQIVMLAFIVVGVVLFPLMPLFLTLGIIRPLTRGSRKIYSKFTRIVKPWTKDLNYLVDRNIVRNPRRASNLCIIISLALAFGIFVSVTMESNVAYQRDTVRAEIGADVKVDGSRYSYPTRLHTDPTKLEQVRSIEGVESVAFYTEFPVSPEFWSYYMGASLILIDPDEYSETVKPSDFYFIDGGREMLDELKTNGTALLEDTWQEQYYVEEGDTIRIHAYGNSYDGFNWTTYETTFDILVVGFVKALPGTTDPNMVYMDRSSVYFMNEDNLTQLYARTYALIDVSEGVAQDTVGDQALEIFNDAGFSTSYDTAEAQLQRLNQDPFYGSMEDFLYLEYLLAGSIMTVGVGLLIFVAVADREKELACIMARGSTGAQIRKILMGESLTLIILGLVVGTIVGLLSAYLFNTLLTWGIFGDVERRIVFSWVSGGVILASVVALLAASLIATARAGKIKLAEVLRIRGG
jgi:ABC-type antimicrobial peptide transport system permease subunit